MEFKNIILTIEEGIAFITINRPDKLNALNNETLIEIDKAWTQIEDSAEIKGIIITGEGQKAFIAGADISEIAKLDRNDGEEYSLFGQRIFSRIENSEKPVIAAVNGFALGGGCELAMACHIRIASEIAKFGQPEVNLAVIPGFGGTQRLPRLVGKGHALELILSGKIIDAHEALRIGLINSIAPPEGLINASIKILHTILSKGPVAVSLVIDSINKGLDTSLQEGLSLEAKNFAVTCASADKEEGTKAFLEKRTPKFTGK